MPVGSTFHTSELNHLTVRPLVQRELPTWWHSCITVMCISQKPNFWWGLLLIAMVIRIYSLLINKHHSLLFQVGTYLEVKWCCYMPYLYLLPVMSGVAGVWNGRLYVKRLLPYKRMHSMQCFYVRFFLGGHVVGQVSIDVQNAYNYTSSYDPYYIKVSIYFILDSNAFPFRNVGWLQGYKKGVGWRTYSML